MSKEKNIQNELEEAKTAAQNPCAASNTDQSNKYVMRWFGGGFLVSIPISLYILGKDDHASLHVKDFTTVFILTPALGFYIYQRWKGIKPGEPFLENSLVKTYYINSITFVAGHAIGFATMHFFGKLHLI